ncbi:hypothetical protein RI367_003176 [Sorochytrium milnesiophthora]
MPANESTPQNLPKTTPLTPPTLADVHDTVFFLCDMHEYYIKGSFAEKEVVGASQKLIDIGKVLDIPLVIAESDMENCGSTIEALDKSQAVLVSKKKKFSMMIEDVTAKLRQLKARTVVLFGVETHVCIMQTALDLAREGYTVQVPQDTTTATNAGDIWPALERMRSCGIIITTTDTLAHELIKGGDHEKIDKVSNIVSKHMQESRKNPLLKLPYWS